MDAALVPGGGVAQKADVTVVVQRPNKVMATAESDKGERQLFADGKTFTLLDAKMNLYSIVPMQTSIDGLVDQIDQKYGFIPPLAEFAVSDPYKEFRQEATAVSYVGRAKCSKGWGEPPFRSARCSTSRPSTDPVAPRRAPRRRRGTARARRRHRRGDLLHRVPRGAPDREQIGSPLVVVRLDPAQLRAAGRAGRLGARRDPRLLEDLHARRLRDRALSRAARSRRPSPGPALVCPCHYSTFDPATGGDGALRPRGRALPQLPLEIDAAGELRAGGNFSGPVGPVVVGRSPAAGRDVIRARRPLPRRAHRRGAVRAQGAALRVPRPLVVPARRGRALRVHRPRRRPAST